MRRSIRDSIVGFSVFGAIITFTGGIFWVRGIRLGAESWTITAKFPSAAGLTERSPVTYRGILVGTVKKIDVSPQAVKTTLEINRKDLRLPLPVKAKIFTSSILGGDVQVALESNNKVLPPEAPLPIDSNCLGSKILCDKSEIVGRPLTSISTLTEAFQQILKDGQQQEVVSNLVGSAKQFDQTQKNLDELILQMKEEVNRAEPIIKNLNKATQHISNIMASLDNPKTLEDLKQTASSARSMTKRIDSVGGDVEKMMSDEDLMDAVRSVTIGLGQFFNELYPYQIEPLDE